MRTAILLSLLLPLLFVDAAEAARESCPDFASETLTLGPPTIYADNEVSTTSPWLDALDRLENDGNDRFETLLSDAAHARGAVFRIEAAFTPTPAVEAEIRGRARATMDSCGESIPYRSLLPGRYAFVHPLHARDLVRSEILVAPGRDFIELRVREPRIRAIYPVVCARFADDPVGACAPTETSVRDLDTLPESSPRSRTSALPQRRYETEKRLQRGAFVSWSLAGIGVGGVIAGALLSPRDCCNDGIGYLVVLPVSVVLTIATTVSGAVATHRLRELRRAAKATSRVSLAPNGLGVRF